MLSSVSKIYIGRQQKYQEWVPGADNRAEIMAQAMGRSGGLRAPTLKSGKIVFIGFCEDMYRDHI